MSTEEKDVKNDEMYEGGEAAGADQPPAEDDAAAREAKAASADRWAKRREVLRT